MPRSKADFRDIQKLADRYGYDFARHTGQGHYLWIRRSDGYRVVTVSKTDNWRAIKNVERNFKTGMNYGRQR